MLKSGVETKVDCFPLASSCGLRIKRQGIHKPRMHPVFPGVSGLLRFGVHNNSLNNGCRALVERVFRSPDAAGVYQPPPPCTADVHSRLKRFRTALLGKVGVHRPIDRDKFLEYYSGRRRLCYERAVRSLEERPLTEADFGVKKAFVKAEKINFTAKPDPAPRVIQPRDPRYNVEVGVYLRPLEHKIYQGIADIYGGPTVMKGYSAEGVARELRAMWDTFSDPVGVGLDASRFDQHVRAEMLAWEHSVYTSCFQAVHSKRLRWLLKGQIHNRCFLAAADGRIKYRVHGSRMSGDMNTALGNCLIMCALVHTLAAERGVRVRLGNNGDDCIVMMERRDLARFTAGLREWFLEFGFNMKVEEPVDRFERVEFCQAHPVFDGAVWVMVRNYRTCLSKDACCVVKDYGWGVDAKRWLASVGECGLAMSGGIPVMQEYYAAFMRNGSAARSIACVDETGMALLAKGLHREARTPSETARVSFFEAFGLLPSAQEVLEEHLRGAEFDVPSSPGFAQLHTPSYIPVY